MLGPGALGEGRARLLAAADSRTSLKTGDDRLAPAGLRAGAIEPGYARRLNAYARLRDSEIRFLQYGGANGGE
jgi:hypothetical protein